MKNQPAWAPYLFFGGVGFVGGILTCFLVYFIFYHKPTPSPVTALRQSDLNAEDHYKFIDPLLGLKGTSTPPTDFVELQKSITFFIDSEIKKGNLVTASVNVRDINRPASIYINDKEQYSPASLLKVPVLMVYLKMAETDPSILTKQIFYSGNIDYNTKEIIRSSTQLKSNTTYSIEELIQYMIKYSDNNAVNLLTQNLNTTSGQGFVNDLFNDLGIHEVSVVNDFLTVRDYILFFRVLYNATYLSRSMSEKALELLSQGDFVKGIYVGVPDTTIKISHKFGEFSLALPTGEIQRRELHDCGVVYYPEHPYMLCVMTKGKDFTELERVIGTISSMAFDHIQTYYSTHN